jgi:hypothetical protein
MDVVLRYPNFDPELDSTIDGERLFHDGQTGWITDQTQWIPATTGTMNGISPWQVTTLLPNPQPIVNLLSQERTLMGCYRIRRTSYVKKGRRSTPSVSSAEDRQRSAAFAFC